MSLAQTYKPSSIYRVFVSLLLFNGVTAVAGGASLIAEVNNPPLSYLESSPFGSYVIPGLILAVVVGGSSLLAAWYVIKKYSGAASLSLASGFIMLGWIVGELAFVQVFSLLQLIYISTGLAVVYLTLKSYPAQR
jgi:hypothetical protein